jgi:class 3 adenylate cyclase/tetratricopeptide (TPR) repeat protein
MAQCPQCGEENPERARFCLACATPLTNGPQRLREERKIVTVLFADLVGFTARAEQMDPEDVRAILAPYHVSLREQLEQYGGTVEKFIGDAVMAVFGAPLAHEDDPERAVRAALAIRDGIIAEGELQVRVGITTGEALVSIGARPELGEGMAAGDVVNTAARLQAAAPVNAIVVDEATYGATKRVIQYGEQPTIEAKGKKDPVSIWEAVEARAHFGVDVRQLGGTPLLGRAREIEALRNAFERTRAESSPQLVTIVGVPGIGKSRMVWELFQEIDRDSDLVSWRQGRSLPYGEAVSFWAFAEMVKAEAGILETDEREETDRKLASAVKSVIDEDFDTEWVTDRLRPLVGTSSPEELGEDNRHEAFAGWRRFVEGLAERGPLVLVFEDLHWADDGLLDFIDYLVERVGDVPLFVLCTARPELLTRRSGWGGGKPNASTISLSPLSPEDTAELVRTLVGRSGMSAGVQATLQERAGGNPLYAEEFARLLVERPSAETLPETVQGLIAARLDGLQEEEKGILQDAAVVGKVFWLGALAAEDRPTASLEEHLHVLERKEFIRREQRSSVTGESEYAFRHLLVRDVAYSQIPRARRVQKHIEAARFIESLGRPDDHAELRAHHYLAALDLADASSQRSEGLDMGAALALREAGNRALALNSFAAAGRYYARALELWPTGDGERAGLLLQYGRALRINEGGGEAVLEEARDELLAIGEYSRAAEANILLAELAWYNVRPQETEAFVGEARRLIADAEPSRIKAHVLATVARYAMLADRQQESVEVGRQALAIAEELQHPDLQAHALFSIGTARANMGDWDGMADVEKGIRIGLEANWTEVPRGYNNLAALAEGRGELSRAFELRKTGAREATRLGTGYMLRWFEATLPEDHYWAGEWDLALATAERALTAAEDETAYHQEHVALRTRGRIRLARGDVAGALEDALRAATVGLLTDQRQASVPSLAFSARVHFDVGEKDAAGRAVDQLTALWGDGRFGPAGEWADLAVLLPELGRSSDLLALLDQAVPTLWTKAARLWVGRDLIGAADIYAEMGSRPDEAQARLQAARVLIDADRLGEARSQLEQGLAFYRLVDASHHVRDGEALVLMAED